MEIMFFILEYLTIIFNTNVAKNISIIIREEDGGAHNESEFY